jgi:hypothetical protein
MDLQKPIAWVGEDKADRLLVDDTTRHGLRRMVVARKGEPMEVSIWLSTAESEARGPVDSWLVERDGFFLLWMVWKGN